MQKARSRQRSRRSTLSVAQMFDIQTTNVGGKVNEEDTIEEDISFGSTHTIETDEDDEPTRRKCGKPVDEVEEDKQPARKTRSSGERWQAHLADLNKAWEEYASKMREAQGVSEVKLNWRMNVHSKRKRSLPTEEIEEVEEPARKKHCLEEAWINFMNVQAQTSNQLSDSTTDHQPHYQAKSDMGKKTSFKTMLYLYFF